ncbi:DNA repair exonuclease SbcCD ATPase subunit [Aquamicrobium lusatiense]|uniref:DNA repair exonuclease SbcCD ATPase subunit n=1 Tax=Aquamicrobium lusatiense TaxID=89772 RepID=A0A7W9VUB3_9HYPH|nr:DNA-binding protein [Aquamicrobium lusatiense]MBB6010817.1 DNA repair exonuclease SbcCD ATPase subunit [Aquamicrobium lusatiense]
MKISALRLFNVKRFGGRGVAIEDIGDGVNVLSEANEFGKSTSFEALHALFFQPHSSVSADVRSLRPYSGGNPLVEADIATAEGRFRITKQYYGGRSARVTDLGSGRLIAQADEAENFIAGLIRGGSAGPAGLLWVRQGITGIEARRKSEEDSEKQARAGLLESVQGEVEAITGGRRMAEIARVVSEEIEKLVTKRGPKAGGRYAAAIETRDRLTAEEQRLSAEVTSLRAALDQRAAAARRLSELEQPQDRQERRAAVEKAQAALNAAKSQREMLNAAEAKWQLSRDRRDLLAQNCGTLLEAQEKAQALRGRLEEAESRHAQATEKRREAAAAMSAARAQAEAAEQQEQETRDLLSRLDAALKARDAAQRHAALLERLKLAEDARLSLEQAEAKHALIKIDPKTIDDLQALEVEIARLRALGDAARPSIAIVYEPGADHPIHMDGVALADGEERRYDGEAHLSVPGIGAITLRSNRPAPDDSRLKQAVEKRRALLAALEADDLAAVRARHEQAQQIAIEMQGLRSRLSALAPAGLAKLREEVAAQEPAAAEAVEITGEPEEIRAAHAQSDDNRKAARQALWEAEPLQRIADEAFIAAQTDLAALRAELVQIEVTLGPEDGRAERRQELSGQLDEAVLKLEADGAELQKLRDSAADLESVEATLRRARSVEEAAEKEAAALRETIAELNGLIRALADDAVEEKWHETREALSAANARVAAFEKEVGILQRLSSALESARTEASDLYLKPVITELRPLLGLLFDDVAISFDDKTLLPRTILRNGQEEEVERLSGGMREQLSVLTRLAFARLLARDGRPTPVILDDALVYSDDDRIEKMFDALHRQSRDQQIIVFSCRQRAFQKLGGNILRMTDWQP